MPKPTHRNPASGSLPKFPLLEMKKYPEMKKFPEKELIGRIRDNKMKTPMPQPKKSIIPQGRPAWFEADLPKPKKKI